MMQISVPELSDRPLAMVPDEAPDQTPLARQTRSAAATTGVDGRLRLGGPVAVPVSKSYLADSPDLQTFIERESAQYRYHLVHLSVTATTERRQPRFERIVVQLRLSAQGEEMPVAWSMMPSRVDSSSDMSTTVRLGPQLKLFDASVEHTESRSTSQPYLEALNELRSDPAWDLRRTRSMEISGVHRLMMVVRAPVGAVTVVEGTVRASTARGRHLWHGRAALSDEVELTLALA